MTIVRTGQIEQFDQALLDELVPKLEPNSATLGGSFRTRNSEVIVVMRVDFAAQRDTEKLHAMAVRQINLAAGRIAAARERGLIDRNGRDVRRVGD